ncbi:PAS domain S-box protein [Marinilabiliaceae bacterium JC017]|nr:PAS domain S-box protein [Marinilabiliaceae bacterium JC017]
MRKAIINQIVLLSLLLFGSTIILPDIQLLRAQEIQTAAENIAPDTGWKEIQSLFLQVGILLGLSLAAYLYVNLRTNRLKRSTATLQPPSKPKAIHPGISVMDLPYAACCINDKWQIQQVNKAFEAFTAKDKKALVGMEFPSIMECQDALLKKEITEKALASDQPYFTRFIKRKMTDKTEKYVKLTVYPQHKLEQTPTRWIITVEDVSQLSTCLQAIDEQKEIFTHFINKFPDAIFLEDFSGTIIDVNNRACQLLEGTREQLIGLNIMDLTPVEFHEAYKARIPNIATEEGYHFKSYSFTLTGKKIPVEINANKVTYFDQEALLYSVRNISNQVSFENRLQEALKKAEDADRLKTSFLANMSHEVRTPMNCIMGFSELMCDPQLQEEERREYHQIVKTSGYELLNLLDDIIEFSKLESETIHLKEASFSPEDILLELKKTALELLENKKSVKLKLSAPAGLASVKYITDIDRLKQILRNFIENAIKFTYEGSVEYGYRTRANGGLDFFVKDTGIGIPKEKIHAVFNKFMQVDNSYKREFGGMGLGLAICHHLASYLQGYIWVESEEHKGATFHLALPPKALTGQTNELNQLIRPDSNILLYDPQLYLSGRINTELERSYRLLWASRHDELKYLPMSNLIKLVIIETSHINHTLLPGIIEHLRETQPDIPVILFDQKAGQHKESNYPDLANLDVIITTNKDALLKKMNHLLRL